MCCLPRFRQHFSLHRSAEPCLRTVSVRIVGVCIWMVFGVLTAANGRAQDLSLDEFRRLNNELRQKMSQDMEGAETYLEGLIKESPESSDLQVLRESLATQWAAQGKFKRANDQLDRLLDFQIQNLSLGSNRFGIPMTIRAFQDVNQSSRSSALQKAVDRSYEALRDAEVTEPDQLIPLAQLSVLKAQSLADQKEQAEAFEIAKSVTSQLAEASSKSVDVTQTLIQTLRALTTSDPANDAWRDQFIEQLGEVVANAMDTYADSVPIQTAFAEVEFMRITQWEQEDPEKMKEQIGETVKRLNPLAFRNRSVNAILRRLVLHRERMATAEKSVSSLVGQMAPEWDVDAWVNVIDLDRDSLKGKVVLVDFWAMWCGPCIATFPHLREWREEFGEKGFEIVGVTQYYNFRWDEENKRPIRSTEDADPAAERKSIDQFLQHHELKHPVMVTPEGSDMSSAYGVQGIPHVVLIDKQGVVQLVKVGAGQATADEIEAKIRELLEK